MNKYPLLLRYAFACFETQYAGTNWWDKKKQRQRKRKGIEGKKLGALLDGHVSSCSLPSLLRKAKGNMTYLTVSLL
jgi:hypothetical protein